MTKPKLFTLFAALVAALALSSTALAQGGGGGGAVATSSCAQIVDFAQPLTYDANNQPQLQTSFTVSYLCPDHEKTGRVAIDWSNSVTGPNGRSFWAFGGGTFSWTSGVGAATPGVSYTATLTVYLPNGKIADRRTITTVVPAA